MNANVKHQVGEYLVMGSTLNPQIKVLYSVIDITEDNKLVVQECKDSERGDIYILKWNKDLEKWIWRQDIYDKEPLIAEFVYN